MATPEQLSMRWGNTGTYLMHDKWDDDGVGCAVFIAFMAGFFFCAWWYELL